MSIQISTNVSGVNMSASKLENDQKAALVAQLKRLYSADQQAEFLFIQAEADSIVVELERIKAQQKQPAVAR